jgi:hypothetical protein
MVFGREGTRMGQCLASRCAGWSGRAVHGGGHQNRPAVAGAVRCLEREWDDWAVDVSILNLNYGFNFFP